MRNLPLNAVGKNGQTLCLSPLNSIFNGQPTDVQVVELPMEVLCPLDENFRVNREGTLPGKQA